MRIGTGMFLIVSLLATVPQVHAADWSQPVRLLVLDTPPGSPEVFRSALGRFNVQVTDMAAPSGEKAQLGSPDALLVAWGAIALTSATQLPMPDQQTLREYVRRGGGLLLISRNYKRPWSETYQRTPIEEMAPCAFIWRNLYGPTRATEAVEHEITSGLAWNEAPRVMHFCNVAIPGNSIYARASRASLERFAKSPLSHGWVQLVYSGDPARRPLLSVCKFGAGRVAIWASDYGEKEFAKWSYYGRFWTELVRWLAGAKARQASGERKILLLGDVPRYRWEHFGMTATDKLQGQLTDFCAVIASEGAKTVEGLKAYVSAGGLVIATAPSVLEKMNLGEYSPLRVQDVPKPGQPSTLLLQADWRHKVVPGPLEPELAAPDLDETGWDAGNSAQIPQPAAEIVAPVGPELQIPQQWRFRKDPEDKGLSLGYQEVGLDESTWEMHNLGRFEQDVCGRKMGFDGALWYRTKITVPETARKPNSALWFHVDSQYYDLQADVIQVWANGEKVADANGGALVPVARLKAGENVLVVRVYDFRYRNFGLQDVQHLYLPTQFRPDPDGAGEREQWFAPDLAGAEKWSWIRFGAWQEQGYYREGGPCWYRFTVHVPEERPGNSFELHIDGMEPSPNWFRAWLNGREAGEGEHLTLPGSAFAPGDNIICVVTERRNDLKNLGITARVESVATAWFRTRISLDATAAASPLYINTTGYAELYVDGVPMGASRGRLMLPGGALTAGKHVLALAMRHQGSVSISSMESLSEGGPPTPFGWRCRGDTNGEGWAKGYANPQLNDHRWRPVDWSATKVGASREIQEGLCWFRGELQLRSRDLAEPLLLEFAKGAVKAAFANGYPLHRTADGLFVLNGTVKEGSNVIAFAAELSPSYQIAPPKLLYGKRGLLEAAPGVGFIVPTETLAVGVPTVLLPHSTSMAVFNGGRPAIAIQRVAQGAVVTMAPGLARELAAREEVDPRTQKSFEQEKGIVLPSLVASLLEPARVKVDSVVLRSVEGPFLVKLRNESKREAGGLLTYRVFNWDKSLVAFGELPFTLPAGAVRQLEVPVKQQGIAWEATGYRPEFWARFGVLPDGGATCSDFVEGRYAPDPDVIVRFILDDVAQRRSSAKLESLTTRSSPFLDWSDRGNVEHPLYTPGETAHLGLEILNRSDQTFSGALTANLAAAVSGTNENLVEGLLELAPRERKLLRFDRAMTSDFECYRLTARLESNGRVIASAERPFYCIKPHRKMAKYCDVHHPSARFGVHVPGDRYWAQPFEIPCIAPSADHPAPYNDWANANMVSWVNDSLAWGPFRSDWSRPKLGILYDSFGFFPNGQPFMDWFKPYLQRMVRRAGGGGPVTLELNDGWGAPVSPEKRFTPVQIRRFVQYMAATKKVNIKADTIAGYTRLIKEKYPAEWHRFVVEDSIVNTFKRIRDMTEEVAPGSTLWLQGDMAYWADIEEYPETRKLARSLAGVIDGDSMDVTNGQAGRELHWAAFANGLMSAMDPGKAINYPHLDPYMSDGGMSEWMYYYTVPERWRTLSYDFGWLTSTGPDGALRHAVSHSFHPMWEEKSHKLTASPYDRRALYQILALTEAIGADEFLGPQFVITDKPAHLDAPPAHSRGNRMEFYRMLLDAGAPIGSFVHIEDLAASPAKGAIVLGEPRFTDQQLHGILQFAKRSGLLVACHTGDENASDKPIEALLGVRRAEPVDGAPYQILGSPLAGQLAGVRGWDGTFRGNHHWKVYETVGEYVSAGADVIALLGSDRVGAATREAGPARRAFVGFGGRELDFDTARLVARLANWVAGDEIIMPEGTCGYGFRGAGRTYVVLEELQSRERTVQVKVNVPPGETGRFRAINLNDNRRLDCSFDSETQMVTVRVPLLPSSAALIAILPG